MSSLYKANIETVTCNSLGESLSAGLWEDREGNVLGNITITSGEFSLPIVAVSRKSLENFLGAWKNKEEEILKSPVWDSLEKMFPHMSRASLKVIVFSAAFYYDKPLNIVSGLLEEVNGVKVAPEEMDSILRAHQYLQLKSSSQ